jgi:hypothetical protein
VTARGLELGGPLLHRTLALRAELLRAADAERRRILAAIAAARSLAQRAQDPDAVAHATELQHQFMVFGAARATLSQDEITSILDHERTASMPTPRTQPRKKSRARKSKSTSIPKKERGLFEP